MGEKSDIKAGVLISVFVLLVLTAFPAAAETGACEPIPESANWGKVTHKSIVSYVQRKHGGDWAPYIAKWEKQLRSMRAIHTRGGSAVFKSRGVTLKDDELLDYVRELEKRVAITRCLSKE